MECENVSRENYQETIRMVSDHIGFLEKCLKEEKTKTPSDSKSIRQLKKEIKRIRKTLIELNQMELDKKGAPLRKYNSTIEFFYKEFLAWDL